MNKPKRIGIFGGSFDPVHNGHLELALLAKKEYSLDRVIFVPAYHPPHKKTRKLTSANHRLKMLKLSLKPYPFFYISHFELNKKKPVYTYQTVRYFKDRFKNSEIFFIMGSDSLAEIKTWKKPSLIASSCAIITGKRAGIVLKQAPFKRSILFLTKKIADISSTQIRENIQHNKPINKFVPVQVEKHIKTNRIYER